MVQPLDQDDQGEKVPAFARKIRPSLYFQLPLLIIDGLAPTMYTRKMEKPSPRSWDWLSAGLLFLLIQVAGARLVTTNWAPYLYFVEILAGYGAILGLALGASRYRRRAVIWFVIDYSAVVLPWQMSAIADPKLPFWDRLVQVSHILFTAL